MAAALLSSPTVISSSFFGQRLSVRGNSKKIEPCYLIFRSPRCSLDAPSGVGWFIGTLFSLLSNDLYVGKFMYRWYYSGEYWGVPRPEAYGNALIFPRINIWNPYKRLGITIDASEEEVWSARNFLVDQYTGHERSVESIEAAFEKLLMTSFKNRKKTKINLKTQLKKKVEESPPWVKNLLSFVEVPPTVIILRRLFLFSFMACWSVMNSAEAGPAFQVALSLAACIYFLNDKSKSLPRAAIFGFGALVVGWISGSLMIPLIPSSLLQPTWTLELLTSLVAYIFLFLACTFLK